MMHSLIGGTSLSWYDFHRDENKTKLEGPLPCVCFELYGRKRIDHLKIQEIEVLIQAIKSSFLCIFWGWVKIYLDDHPTTMIGFVEWLSTDRNQLGTHNRV